MLNKSLLQALILPLVLLASNSAAMALPGQPMEEVETWINPLLSL